MRCVTDTTTAARLLSPQASSRLIRRERRTAGARVPGPRIPGVGAAAGRRTSGEGVAAAPQPSSRGSGSPALRRLVTGHAAAAGYPVDGPTPSRARAARPERGLLGARLLGGGGVRRAGLTAGQTGRTRGVSLRDEPETGGEHGGDEPAGDDERDEAEHDGRVTLAPLHRAHPMCRGDRRRERFRRPGGELDRAGCVVFERRDRAGIAARMLECDPPFWGS